MLLKYWSNMREAKLSLDWQCRIQWSTSLLPSFLHSFVWLIFSGHLLGTPHMTCLLSPLLWDTTQGEAQLFYTPVFLECRSLCAPLTRESSTRSFWELWSRKLSKGRWTDSELSVLRTEVSSNTVSSNTGWKFSRHAGTHTANTQVDPLWISFYSLLFLRH